MSFERSEGVAEPTACEYKLLGPGRDIYSQPSSFCIFFFQCRESKMCMFSYAFTIRLETKWNDTNFCVLF